MKPENILIFPMNEAGATAPVPAGQHKAMLAALKKAASDSCGPDSGHSASEAEQVAAAARGRLRRHLVKLCDFGSALVVREDLIGSADVRGMSAHGSTKYAPPETLLRHTYNVDASEALKLWPEHFIFAERSAGYSPFPVDVWSFGVTLFALAAGRLPFRHACITSSTFRAFLMATQRECLHDTMAGPKSTIWHSVPLAQLRWAWPSHFSPALTHLLGGCLRLRPAERWTMAQVMAHPWFGNPGWNPHGAPTGNLSPRLARSPTPSAPSSSSRRPDTSRDAAAEGRARTSTVPSTGSSGDSGDSAASQDYPPATSPPTHGGTSSSFLPSLSERAGSVVGYAPSIASAGSRALADARAGSASMQTAAASVSSRTSPAPSPGQGAYLLAGASPNVARRAKRPSLEGHAQAGAGGGVHMPLGVVACRSQSEGAPGRSSRKGSHPPPTSPGSVAVSPARGDTAAHTASMHISVPRRVGAASRSQTLSSPPARGGRGEPGSGTARLDVTSDGEEEEGGSSAFLVSAANMKSVPSLGEVLPGTVLEVPAQAEGGATPRLGRNSISSPGAPGRQEMGKADGSRTVVSG